MKREDMLARLMAQETAAGGDMVTLRAIVEEASELGAARMLARMGLNDETAPDDLSELREMLRAWRDAKASMGRAVIDWAVRGVMALMVIGLAWRSGAMELLR
jgi:hypothetical protein